METKLTRPQRFAAWLSKYTGLAAVTAIPVGSTDDGMILHSAGTMLDKSWGDLYTELTDAREAWHKNPIARRIVGLITSYTVGNGIHLQSDHEPLQDFIDAFWLRNSLDQRIDDWTDELSRSGELFPVLFYNPISGQSSVRTIPACLIESIEYDDNDYETELRYRETQPIGAPEKWWLSPNNSVADPANGVMLHYAVNRPTGTVRGESDLASILPWLRRYNRWLEDRVRLNAAVRSFLWIVHAPSRMRSELEERYRKPPSAGSVIVAEEGAETWEAVTPNLRAADAEKDGRAIRWMIVAGGPGIALLDIGEGEDSNLATGKAMAEQRRRFLRRRQSYLVYMLIDLVYVAWSLSSQASDVDNAQVTIADITALTPDISPEDNTDLATAASSLAQALTTIQAITGTGETFRAVALRMFAKFAGENLSENDVQTILKEGDNDPTRSDRPGHTAGRAPRSPANDDDEQSESQLSSGSLAEGEANSTQAGTEVRSLNGTPI